AGGGLVRACLAATLGGMLASAAPGRPLATGRVACGRRAALTARRPRAGRRSPDDRPAFLLLALVGEPVGWRRHPSGPGAAFGALPRLVHTLAILTPQLLADALLELGRQARERGAVVVVGLDEGRGGTTRSRPDPARDGAVPFDCHPAVGGIATRGDRGCARPEPRGEQQRQQADADRGECTRDSTARQAFRADAAGAASRRAGPERRARSWRRRAPRSGDRARAAARGGSAASGRRAPGGACARVHRLAWAPAWVAARADDNAAIGAGSIARSSLEVLAGARV